MSRPTALIIDTKALEHNFNCVKQITPNSSMMVMVKANAYGHGLENIVHAFSQADSFGVSCLEEAIMLREAGVEAPVALLEGFFDQEELTTIFENNFELIIHDVSLIDIVEQCQVRKPITVWIKINTGMQRLGISVEEVPAVWKRLSQSDWVKDKPRFLTHFSNAFNFDAQTTVEQMKIFNDVTSPFEAQCSLANSAGILGWPQSHTDWVRPGIVLYGVSPFTDKVGADHGLKPAMELHSSLISIRQCCRGDAISYGGTWVCPEDMPIGVVAIGYGDGYPLHAKSGTPVLLNGRVAPLVGRVCMDMLMIDLRGHENAKVGDKILLWGEALPIETIAGYADTIGYELMCNVTPRVPRIVV